MKIICSTEGCTSNEFQIYTVQRKIVPGVVDGNGRTITPEEDQGLETTYRCTICHSFIVQ